MEKIRALMEEIELLRARLDQAIADELSADEIYARSVALDKVIELYMDIA